MSNLIEGDYWYITETEIAIKVSSDEEEDDAVWLPKSEIEFPAGDSPNGAGVIEISAPEWLLTEKGLL